MSIETSADGVLRRTPTLAEDLLLLLFQPDSRTIAGENTLYYVLAGAVLAELALRGGVTTTTTRGGSVTVEAVDEHEPTDPIFESAWRYVSERPRGVQAVLAAIGPNLRQPLLDRLVARGDLREKKRKALGLFPTTALVDGGNGRRGALLDEVRAVLVDGATPTPRAAALAALVWGSGALPRFHPAIPWNSSVIARARELERNWSAAAAAEAVTRTMTAIVVNSVIAAAAVVPPQ